MSLQEGARIQGTRIQGTRNKKQESSNVQRVKEKPESATRTKNEQRDTKNVNEQRATFSRNKKQET